MLNSEGGMRNAESRAENNKDMMNAEGGMIQHGAWRIGLRDMEFGSWNAEGGIKGRNQKRDNEGGIKVRKQPGPVCVMIYGSWLKIPPSAFRLPHSHFMTPYDFSFL